MKQQIILLTILVILAILYTNRYERLPVDNSQNILGNYNNKYLRIDDPQYDQYLKASQIISFQEWCRIHRKIYSNQKQKAYRMQVYTQNIIHIKQHNILYQLGKQTFFKGINAYADLTPQQFTQKFNWKTDPTLSITSQCTGSIMDAPNPPAEFDWGNKVGEVVDQGQCGKDWAIVAISAVQSLYSLKLATLPSLSVQQLLQCSVDYGNQGCYGGFMDQAFQYIIDNGIATSKSYPDQAVGKCRYSLNMKFTGFTKCARVPSKSYSKLLSAIVQQPVSVALDQNLEMQFYRGGIYSGKCTSALNHGMLLVGYGGLQVENYYWKLRNSLGTTWGDNGFIKLKRVESDGDGQCGIQIWPSVPQNIL